MNNKSNSGKKRTRMPQMDARLGSSMMKSSDHSNIYGSQMKAAQREAILKDSVHEVKK